ncbi:SRPBCC domain-containing protein [Streptomyces sp. NPDC058773]|uniref:SRPBCC domain-containing protein n=1 Tax=Streptomyces sp. NPDC058773 TaxID=3346632 RepID=UPI0036905191
MKPHSDTLTTADGRTALRMERRLTHPPAKVWSAITDPAHIGQWFPSGVTEVTAPRVLAYRWHPEGTVRWELGQGTGHGPRLI